MQNSDLKNLFIEELADMYSAEKQIIEALPQLIRLAFNADLKTALSDHLDETMTQKERIEEIFGILAVPRKEQKCAAMEGLVKETHEIVANKEPSALLDAAIISACQKIEHYEIASYGTLKSFAQHLNLPSDIKSLIRETLDEEAGADKKLTKIAEGSLFTKGVNKEAATDHQCCR